MTSVAPPDWDDSPENVLRNVVAGQLEAWLRKPTWVPLPHQIPPPGDDWLGWLLLGGRGSGKSAACSRYTTDHVNGPPCLPGPVPHWISIVAPTLGDAATSCFAGPAGIRQFTPEAQLKQRAGGLVVEWPNGSQAKLYGTREPDDIERLRAGGNTCLAWLEELAAWRYLDDAFNHLRFGLRTGPRPRWIGSTTPKPRELIKKLIRGGVRGVALTHATMYDNPHLPAHIREALEEAYAGTATGDQELLGQLVEQDENALFTRDNLAAHRYLVVPDWVRKNVTGVDPSGGAGEQGIVVVGSGQTFNVEQRRVEKHGFVIADRSVRLKPEGWGRTAVLTAVEYESAALVVETNFGGDMAVSTLATAAEDLGIAIPIRTVHAAKGKKPRAQPVSAMAVQGRWHMVGEHPLLEDQLCTWTEDANWSPDRLDAMVWPAWYLKLVSTIYRAVGSFGGGIMSQRSLARGR